MLGGNNAAPCGWNTRFNTSGGQLGTGGRRKEGGKGRKMYIHTWILSQSPQRRARDPQGFLCVALRFSRKLRPVKEVPVRNARDGGAENRNTDLATLINTQRDWSRSQEERWITATRQAATRMSLIKGQENQSNELAPETPSFQKENYILQESEKGAKWELGVD